jgi:hypothetical protein
LQEGMNIYTIAPSQLGMQSTRVPTQD